MKQRIWGSTGIAVPVLGLGTWKMEHDDRASCIASIRAALDHGMSHVDTAELYGNGQVESLVGEAVEGRRQEVFLVSKVLPSNASYKGTLRACERTLKRLRTDYLDGYLLHWPGSHPLEETIAAFEELREAGKIRSWGVSNFDTAELTAARKIAGDGKIACNQVLYHLNERTIEHTVLPECLEHGIAVVAYSPLGAGAFPRNHPELEAIARARGVTPHHIALAFLTRETGTFAVPKASSPEHVRANAEATTLTLTEDELERIRAAFPLQPWRGLPTL